MSHTITGIDLGSWSVKFTVLEAGFRRTRTVACFEELVTQDERPFAERQLEALKAGAARLPSGTTAYVALPGEMLTLRVLDLPFADARKIDQVVGYEMEGQMIHELNDVLLDHAVLSARGKVATEIESGCRALVVAARIEDVRSMLTQLQGCSVDPRSLYVAPLLYRPLSPAVTVDEGDENGQSRLPAARVVVDIGHRRTNVCFVIGDEAVFARTLLHGGDEITKGMHRASNGTWTLEQAEQGKIQLGFVASRMRPAMTNIETRVDVVVREALQPLLRDLRQTLSSFAAKDKAPVDEILLAGGGARLNGLAGFLQDELGVAVMPLLTAPEPKDSSVEEAAIAPEPSDADRFVLADAIARVGARGAREIDLRRGEFQYRASFSVVRQRAKHLLVLAASLVACAGINATISMRRLSAEQKVLKTQFETAAKELFGNSQMDAAAVSAALRRNQKDEMVTLPKATAYDLLDEISRKIPAADKVTIDIDDLDIRPKKTSIKGTIDSAAAVDDVVAKLKDIECFEEISKGPITEVSGGAKQFSLNITSKCP
jgi:general secretion pathway protein L